MNNLSQADLAERMGRPKKTINEIIAGKTAITPETAIQLERVFKTSAQFWLNRDARYSAWLAEQAEDNVLKTKQHRLRCLWIFDDGAEPIVDSKTNKGA